MYIRSCPFCGSKAKIVTDVTNTIPKYPRAIVICEKCKASTDYYIDKDHDGNFINKVLNAWNTRAY